MRSDASLLNSRAGPDLPGAYRVLRVWEHTAYAAHLLRLPPEGRRARFFAAISDDGINTHARRALTVRRSVVLGWFHDGILRGAAELVWDRAGNAEVSFAVEHDFQRRGIGTGLARRVLRAAQNRGLKTITILTEMSNTPMRRLAARFGAAFRIEGREIEGRIAAEIPTPISFFAEIAEEEESFIVAARQKWLALFASWLPTGPKGSPG